MWRQHAPPPDDGSNAQRDVVSRDESEQRGDPDVLLLSADVTVSIPKGAGKGSPEPA